MGMGLKQVLKCEASWQTKSPSKVKGNLSFFRKLSKFLGAPSEASINRARNVGEIRKNINTKSGLENLNVDSNAQLAVEVAKFMEKTDLAIEQVMRP